MKQTKNEEKEKMLTFGEMKDEVAKGETKKTIIAKKKEEERKSKTIDVEPIKITEMKVLVVGTTPLLMEKMSDEVANGLRDKMEGKGKDKKTVRNFEEEVKDKIHYTSEGKVGFPTSGFKKAIVEAAPYMSGMDKKLARSIIVLGDGEMAEIKFKKQTINKAMGRDSGINRAPRPIWRPEFQGWSTTLTIRFNSKMITEDQIVNLLKLAWFHIGIGGWRPQCGGNHGTFTVQ
jgi:hypothetical protein